MGGSRSAMPSFPEWSEHPPVDPARPDVDEMFGPNSRWPAQQAPAGPHPGPPVGSTSTGTDAPAKLSTAAVVAFVVAFVVPPAGVVLGAVARGHARRNRESGQGLAVAAVVVGAVFTVLGILAAVLLGRLLLSGVSGLDVPPPAPPSASPTAAPPGAAPQPSFAAADLARDLTRQLGGNSYRVRDVTCPEDLPGTPGQSVRCTAVFADGQPTDLVVTVTAVRGGSIDYTWRPEARPIARTLLEGRVSDLITEQTGRRPLATSCAGDLPPVVDARIDCRVDTVDGVRRLTVTTTGNTGGQVGFSITAR